MAFGEKCYCCGKVYPRDDLFYCEECLMKLSKAFETGEGVVFNAVKYSLQGTTQGRYLTGGVPPVRFSM